MTITFFDFDVYKHVVILFKQLSEFIETYSEIVIKKC